MGVGCLTCSLDIHPRGLGQYFSVPHLFQLDSSGFQWIPLYSTGIYLCVDFFIFINYILGTFQVIPGHSS